MNCDENRYANVMVGGVADAPELIQWAAQRIKQSCRPSHAAKLTREMSVRRDERLRERARIARDLHDTLLQGFLGIRLQLHAAVEQVPTESPGKHLLNQALLRMQGVINEARGILQGIRSSAIKSMLLEQALSCLREEFAPGDGVQFQVFVTGRPKPLSPAIHEQVFLIAREALINALHHSGASTIEVEIEYLPRQLRVRVRDDGCGMDPKVVASGRYSHWGLVGMRERALNIGARFQIRSRPGAGTEVEISLSSRALASAPSEH